MALPKLDSIYNSNSNKRLLPNTIETDFPPSPSANEFGNQINDWANTGWIGMFHLDMVLSYAIEAGASDIHLNADKPVAFTVLGNIVKQHEFPIPDSILMEDLVKGILSHQAMGVFVRDLDYDASYVIKRGRYKGRRFRVSVYKNYGSDGIVFRTITDEIPTPDQLNIEEEVKSWFYQSSGAILVCGPTGSGKALHIDTLIPTPTGMKRVGEIKIGDKIYDKDKNLTEVLDIHQASKKDKLYKITLENGEVFKASGPHEWVVHNNKGLLSSVTTDEIFNKFEYEYFIPKLNFPVRLYNGYTVEERKELLYSMTGNSELEIIKLDEYTDEIIELANSLGYYTYYENEKLVINKTKKKRLTRIVKIEKIKDNYKDYFCFEVDSESHTYLIGNTFTITHNSTTMASILREIQLTQEKKIITIEKPIEAIFPDDGKALVVQRAIPEDCVDFEFGLTGAMRQNPDYILIGEVRNQTEVSEFLRAAETGHLAMSTIHTVNNVTTLNRIRSLFSGEEQRRILATLGDVLRGIVNQQLVMRKDGTGRFAVREALTIDYKIRRLIAEDNFQAIRDFQEANGKTMEQQLAKAVLADKCTLEEARSKAPDQIYFDHVFEEYSK
jgi:Tfp pilus assembly pilus retraction ATPase PilT|nr:MAG TPA: DNA packaging protein [Caudoviricetes sp.]